MMNPVACNRALFLFAFGLAISTPKIFAAGDKDAGLETNAVISIDAPAWLKRTRIERVTDRMQTQLEWTVRKIRVRWYKDEAAFEKAQSLGPGVRAVTKKNEGLVVMGPTVDDKEFDAIFGHELVHVILGQKYKDAIPPWLEEGLANHLAKYGTVDYRWLAKQPFPEDVRKLSHPFQSVVRNPHYHYQASQALAEMLAKKCDLTNLLRLSVERKIDDYLETYCEIKDLNGEFKKWVLAKGK